MEHQEYPKVLNHPAYQHARKIAEATPAIPPSEGQPFIPAQPERWEPERWPQVTVMSADDEEYYLAKGYMAAGKSDPAAFSTAHASPYVAGRRVSEYPKMVDGVLVQDPNAPTTGFQKYPMYLTPPNGGGAILVNTAAEEEAWLAQWTDPDARGPREAIATDFEWTPAEVAPRTLKLKKEHRAE